MTNKLRQNCRKYSPVDNRHHIRAPERSYADLGVFVNTLVKTRIPQLFLTPEGMPGHVQQLQGELNRLKKIGPSSSLRKEAEEASRFLRSALSASKKAAQENNFSFLWQL